MVVGVGFCKIKVDSNFLLVLKIKCIKFYQDRGKTVDLHTKYTNKKTFSFIYIDYSLVLLMSNSCIIFLLGDFFFFPFHIQTSSLIIISFWKPIFNNCRSNEDVNLLL
jgi:hypothetical protein